MEILINNLTSEQLSQLLESQESHFLDFKSVEIAPAKLTKTVSALANTSGGEIYVGLSEADNLEGKKIVWKGFNN